MFSFQYPNPKTNFPFYHSEDPDIFLDRSHEPVDYTDDDDYVHTSPPEYDDDDEGVQQPVIPQPFCFTTIETDKTFISKRLTQITTTTVRNETPTPPSPSPAPVTTNIQPTNPWSLSSTPVQTATGLSDIIQEQKTKEEDDRKKAIELAARRFARPRSNNASSGGHTTRSNTTPTPTPTPNVPPEKSRLCIYGKDCKNKKKCLRSHSCEEWQPNICRFNKRCRNNKCLYYHEGDDKNTYLSDIINSNKDQMAFYSKNKTMYIKNYNLA